MTKWEYKPEISVRFDTITGNRHETTYHWIEAEAGSIVAVAVANEADGRLIAAAPDMLELLKHLEPSLNGNAWEAVNNVIKKAEGNT